MIPTLTVRDVAERIRQPDENLEVVVNRLRNWTKEGLLKTHGGKNPGRGQPRQYTETAVIDALALDALTSVLGMPAAEVGQMHILGAEKTLLRLVQKAADEFAERELAKEWMWLSIHRDRDRKALGTTAILQITKGESFEKVTISNWSEVSIVLNLTKLFRRLQNPGEK